jgi:DNA-binding transcriptional regulator YiaG
MASIHAAGVYAVRPLNPKEIRALRLREGASQAVFARYLIGLKSRPSYFPNPNAQNVPS